MNSNSHESSGSVTASYDDRDRPWNRPFKKRRSSPTLVVPLDSLEDIPPMEGVLDPSMPPQSLMNYLGDSLPHQDLLTLETPPNLFETIPPDSSEDASIRSAGLETVDSIRQVVIGQLAHTPIEKVLALEKSVSLLMEDMQHAGLSDFRTSLVVLFDKAREYNSQRIKCDSLMTNEAYQERVSAAQGRFEERKASLKETLAKVNDTKSELAMLKAKVDELSKRQEYNEEESRKLQSLVQTDEKMFSFVQHFSYQSTNSTKKLEHVKE